MGWTGYMIAFILTAALAVMTLYSCKSSKQERDTQHATQSIAIAGFDNISKSVNKQEICFSKVGTVV